MGSTILELRGITKAFGEKIANSDISLAIEAGRVHALVGENGAGKTTLMNMISGIYQPDSGEMYLDGELVEISGPNKADSLGIGMVHQHFKLVPTLTVAANVFLGRELRNSFGKLSRKRMEDEVLELSKRFGLEINPTDLIQDLSVGQRQRVEIIKALSHDTRILILDEPTAVLTPAETEELFIVVRRLAQQGCAVVFISHKLEEVLSIADEVTVIRDGRIVETREASGLTQTQIAALMVGRDVLLRVAHTPANPEEEALSVENLFAIDKRGAVAVNNLSLKVHHGEIVGIAGVEGNGQTELADAISGMYRAPQGVIRFDGEDVTRASVRQRRQRGFAYIPEDRHDEGTGPKLSISENMAVTSLETPLARFGWLSLNQMRRFAQMLIAKFDIRGANPETTISTLSGGNMQKVVIAREFSSNPGLLVVSQPTRGVDVGAMEFVHNAILDVRNSGAGVLLISADLNEVMSLSDRLLVMYRGSIVAEFTQENMSEVAVGLAMAGVAPTKETLAEAKATSAKRLAELASTGVAATAHDSKAKEAEHPEEGASRLSQKPPSDSSPDYNAKPSPKRPLFADFVTKTFNSAMQPIVAVLVALVIGSVILFSMGQNPFVVYFELFTSAWRTSYGISAIIASFIPLAIMAAGTIISFRAGFFNIGGEGQLYFGAFFGALAGIFIDGLPPLLHVLLILLVGTLAGALWGLIPGSLYAFWRVDIVVTTLLLSEIAKLITQFFVTGPVKDPQAGFPATEPIASELRISMFSPAYGIGPDLIIAIFIALLLALVLTRSVWGLRVKQLGEMNRFAEYTGVSAKKMAMQVLMVSGAVAGFAGALFVLGANSSGRFLQNFSPGFGFLAITVALLAKLNPWASLLAALFYSTMMAGATSLQSMGVPFPMVTLLQGLIVVAITATFVTNQIRKKKKQEVPEASSKQSKADKK